MAALKKRGLDPSATTPETIASLGIYGWHGTRTAENLIRIAFGNLDPKKRSGQACGPGEYCAVNPSTSQGGYWGNTNTLFLFFILRQNNPYYTLNGHYVINNPSQNEMYMVPILIATFNTQVPLKIESDALTNTIPIKRPVWEWLNQDWTAYGFGLPTMSSTQITIEELYQKYMQRVSTQTFTLTFIRLDNNNTDTYEIDFDKMKQKNMRTNYVRDIRRTML